MVGELVRAARREEPGTTLLSWLAHARTGSRERLTVDEVVDHMNFLMPAEHDTTSPGR